MLKSNLIDIKNAFQNAQSFGRAWNNVQQSLKDLFLVEQIRLYRYDEVKDELFSVIKDVKFQEIRIPVNAKSIAGFTALQRVPLTLRKIDSESLRLVHSDLDFNLAYDSATHLSTTNLVSMPVQFNDDLLGVLQLINKRAGSFVREDEAYCRLLVNIMGQKMYEEREHLSNPYDLLVYRGYLCRENMDSAFDAARVRHSFVSCVLQSDHNIPVEVIGECFESFYQTQFVPFADQPVAEQHLKGISRQYLITSLWVPLHVRGDRAVVLVQNPLDTEKLEEIKRVLNVSHCEFCVGLPEHILAFLGDRSQLVGKITTSAIGALTLPEAEDEAEPEDLFDEDDGSDLTQALAADLEEVGEGLEISLVEEEDISQESRQLAVRFVNKIIMHAAKTGASDIHIEPARTGRPGVVRMRVDGSCERVLSVPETIIKPVISRIKILSNLNISERRLPQDGKARVRFKGRELELRVATLPTVHGESAVLRMLSSGKALPFEKLNLSDANKLQIERLMKKPHGIFLVVGPTGSGKTTTLHSILGQINTPEKKIWTVEDPVEITQPGLQQVQVDNSIGLSFARIMRAFLRADPDVILVGEMRDLETAQIGVEASLTGHMVFTTLHTNSAPETVTRLLDMGVEAINFSEALQGILAQRLVKTLCPNCRVSHAPTDEEWAYLVGQYGAEFISELNVTQREATIYKSKGCARCGQSGYKGRTGIHELLVATPDVRKAIVRKQPAEEISRVAVEQGMRTLYQDGIAKIFKGDIDILQLQKVTVAE